MKTTILLFAAATAVVAQSDTGSVTASGACEPHDDHWHCPAGVPKPTTPPAVAAWISVTSAGTIVSTSSAADNHSHAASATTCEPHNDHWHCPSGVPKPSTLPAGAIVASTWVSTTARATNVAVPAASASLASGAAAKTGLDAQGALVAIAGAVGAWLL
ncbi:hypothetical protein GQ44DRAFT_763822 [Phaeosphaeriaceae sp. PMI808]|nr:hypothetical protein GQ44DRAFT_763822 [Phaeosphaeriaceae sp. PMI808]